MMSSHLVGVVETGVTGFEVGVTGGADGLGEAGVRVVVGTGDETGVWAAVDSCTRNCPKSRSNLTSNLPSLARLTVNEIRLVSPDFKVTSLPLSTPPFIQSVLTYVPFVFEGL